MRRIPVLPDYKLVNIEIENSTSIMYKGYATRENKLILLKSAKQPTHTLQEVASRIHEYHITKDLRMDGIINPIKLEKHLNEPYIILEYFPGVTLREMLKDKKQLDLSKFLSIAIKLTAALINLHKEQIIHKNINPDNIVIHRTTGQIKLTGFYYATTLKKENQRHNITPNEIEGQLPYISPEQTGRMNRSVDYRADLYSLGVVLYEMITGELPFTYEEPMELLHAHLAKRPSDPIDKNDSVPQIISDIIMRLLSKTPETRYKSAFGLREDLKKSNDQLQLFGNVAPFQLGQHDPAATFEPGIKLYGRNLEKELLLKAFERVSNGNAELVLIKGHSGIGKTALVHEIQTPLVKEKGYFISGKFDLLQRQKPYSPILQAFKSLMRLILSEGDERIQSWKTSIKAQLSNNESIITSIIPELKWITGENLEENTLANKDAHLRFHLIFQKFVNAFATKEHPLVLFLDDLQWADTASLELIEYLLTHIDSRYFLLIGAYRHNEIGMDHPFTETINNLKKERVVITEITLNPLEDRILLQWVEEALMDDGLETRQLAHVMFKLTQGNPFFIMQLFQSLYNDESIMFDEELGKWSIRFDRIQTTLEKENIIDLMIKRVQQLPLETQELLKKASCIGNEFDLKTLSTICEKDLATTGGILWRSLEAGLILPEDSIYKWIYPDGAPHIVDQPPTYRFLHDRVQQAVYSLMTKEEKEQTHLKIGRLLMILSAEDHHLFDMVNHLNICRSYLKDEEQLALVQWNVKAGEQAKESAAFKESLEYFQTAYEMFGARWDTHYSLTKQLMTGLGECCYLNSKFEEAEWTLNQVLENVRTNHEKLSIYNLKVVLYTHVHRVGEAVQSGIAGLRMFGWKIHRKPSKALIAVEILQAKIALRKKNTKDLMKLPTLEDQEKILLLNTMITMNAPAFHVDQNLATILMVRALRFSLKHGMTDITSLVFNNYALILSAGFNDFHKSYEFGKLAIEVAERSGNIGLKGRTYFVFGSFINHWKHPLKRNFNYLKQSQQYCIDAGNIHLAGANSSFISITLFMMGEYLYDVLTGIKNQLKFIDKIRYVISKGFLNEFVQWIEVLQNEQATMNWDFEQILDDDSAKIIHYTIRLQLSYLFNQKEFAKVVIDHLEPLVSNRLTLVIISEYYFYDALWASRFYDDVSLFEQKVLYRKLKKNAKKLKDWAKLCPENYQHKWKLLIAEIARIEGKHNGAITNYDDAIQLAKENNFIQDVAISNELAGYYYISRGLESVASAYLTEAYRTYIKWGAYAKARKLREGYASYIMNVSNERGSQSSLFEFDMKASFQASQAISSEIIQERLVHKLMDITMRNAGAERGVLVLVRDAELLVVAIANIDGQIEELSFQPVEDSNIFSEKIVRYVAKSQEAVVLNDAKIEGIFVEDPYVVKNNVKSILCLPAIFKGKLTSILYLENNRTTHVFTEDRIKFLSFLSTQVAISIENAELYGKLEEKVKDRTKELEYANKHLEQMNIELEKSEGERRHLFSNISHDLRAPIASVSGYIQAILDKLIDSEEERDAILRKCLQRVDGLNMMINDIFELAQLESGQTHFSFDFVPIDRLIKRYSEQFEYDVIRNGLNYTVTIEDIGLEHYPMVQVDVKRFNQVFSNIITNAMKHTKIGEISISLHFNKDLEEAYISIQDSGEGIQVEDIPYIFDRNFSKSSEGNGLGLAISREIILLHNGEIWVESEHGKGSTFFIKLPVFQVDSLVDV
ncbi:ATP-binding sensor histidine kinase [Sutcliffiella sp. NC1]|uniref:ATP-binding sensor histidine kinase n=1 Tax=Sutcliffiella sp. NC1 TaxID=3004096 RepID=UPI0022DD24E3|nr:ATP-binding sensor histidine kinase [Sutcliffiella sp. NC1]WBL15500.1 trifunctional serine/threonine-protein kinase/ATP-binding protein/sensor histidine kinase [Sutcliffiella sp. NC1]